jgi:DNA-binding transcriptional LysR family regulator
MPMDPLHKLSWDWIKSYAAVVEQGSISAAASHLQTNAATVSRQIAALEAALGVELFVRSHQGMQPTLAAQQLTAPARAMHQAMTDLSLGAASMDARLQGLVRISVSVSLANFLLPDILSVFRNLHPAIRMEIIATDSQSNLLKRDADIAIRLLQPVQSDLIAKRVAWFALGLYASNSYLKRRGTPRLEAQQLMSHEFIDVLPHRPLTAGFARMGLTQLQERVVCVSSDHASAWQLVKAGIGISSSMRVVAGRDPSVSAVLTDVQPGRFPVWLVTHRGLRQQPRIRLVYDYLAQALKSLSD